MKLIKKHKNKLFIIMLTLISALTLFLNVGKTYAYETDEFSYTVEEFGLRNNDIEGITYDNNTNCMTINKNVASTNIRFKGKLNELTNPFHSYLLINFSIYYSSDNINYNFWDTYNYAQTIVFTILDNNGSAIASETYSKPYLYNTKTKFNNGEYDYYTYINKLGYNNQELQNFNYFGINMTFLDTANYYFKLYIRNIDIVENQDIGLSQYYETYYGQIEENYNNLQELYTELQGEYNDLEEAYEQKQEAYDDLENDYLTLDENYNNLNQQYNEINNYNQYGDFYNCTLYIENITNGITTNHTLTFNDMITNDIISNSFLYYTKAFQYLNINTGVGFTTATLQLAKPIPTSNISWTYKDENISGVTFDLEYVGDDEDWYVSFATDSASPFEINTNFLLNKQLGTNYDISNDSFDQFILTFNYATPNPVWISNNTNYADSYNKGYNNGYSQARNNERQEYEPIINNLRNQINTLNEQVTSQRVVINALQEQISSMSSDYNLNNLIWTIASTPFESFKQIWNVNFLGVNITQMVTGLLTAFIVLYIVKKFFL